MKKFRKLIPALALLLVSAVLMSTASYAWFSMNNKVTVTGMEVKTQVSSNLLIAEDELTSTSLKSDENFKTEITETVKGILEPVSTADAKAFYYTVDAKADGSKNQSTASSAYLPYSSSAVASDATTYKDKFSEVYGVTRSSATAEYNEMAVPYVDYVFQLKATNTSNATQSIVVEQLNLKYNGSADASVSKAHRVCFFVADITPTNAVTGGPAGSSATYTVASSANFENAVISGPTSSSATAYVSAKQALVEVAAGTTKYYKVVVRMWLEGQDTTCNNGTFMQLNDKWELGIKLALVDNTSAAVEYISQVNSSGNLINP